MEKLLWEPSEKWIKTTIRTHASPRHVPAKIIAVPDILCTLNMKKVELAVKKTIEGQPIPNKDALSDLDALDYYKNIVLLKEGWYVFPN